jgi:hypothetical protein
MEHFYPLADLSEIYRVKHLDSPASQAVYMEEQTLAARYENDLGAQTSLPAIQNPFSSSDVSFAHGICSLNSE